MGVRAAFARAAAIPSEPLIAAAPLALAARIVPCSTSAPPAYTLGMEAQHERSTGQPLPDPAFR